MRADPAEYELIAPENLRVVMSLLAAQPGEWLPVAGGTDVMVQYASGKLAARKLISLWNLPELRSIEIDEGEIKIGAGCTYSDLREHEIIQRELPLLARAASWTGGIANQNRGTLGGNIVNASPAADSLPALLAYEAELLLVSVRGERRVRYLDFHTGYKKTLLAPDELIRSICVQPKYAGYFSYARKVGARNAQAISKVCVAGLGRMAGSVVEDVRIAAGSVAPVPLRLRETEQSVRGTSIDDAILARTRKIALNEIRPIDDIRSNAAYRAAVLGNLVAEFLFSMKASVEMNANAVLARWNQLPADEAARELLACCGSMAWARELVARRPIHDEALLQINSDQIWNSLRTEDWLEAFSRHPRIGERKPPQNAPVQSSEWSEQEQGKVGSAEASVQMQLAEGNREYERKFDRVFIVCATGKTADKVLEILRRRLHNDETTELRAAAEEQQEITQLRLKKWLAQ